MFKKDCFILRGLFHDIAKVSTPYRKLPENVLVWSIPLLMLFGSILRLLTAKAWDHHERTSAIFDFEVRFCHVGGVSCSSE